MHLSHEIVHHFGEEAIAVLSLNRRKKSLCHCKITPSAAVADEMPATEKCRSVLAVATAVTSLNSERLCCRGCSAPKNSWRSSCIGWVLEVQRLCTAGNVAKRLASLQRVWCGDERQLDGYWETSCSAVKCAVLLNSVLSGAGNCPHAASCNSALSCSLSVAASD